MDLGVPPTQATTQRVDVRLYPNFRKAMDYRFVCFRLLATWLTASSLATFKSNKQP